MLIHNLVVVVHFKIPNEMVMMTRSLWMASQCVTIQMKATEAATELQQPMDKILACYETDESYCAVSYVLLLMILWINARFQKVHLTLGPILITLT